MTSKRSTADQERGAALSTLTHERVAEVAHQLDLARGGEGGHDPDDWLEAERFLQQATQQPN